MGDKEAEMTIDTLARSKALEAAGVDRRAAEAQAEALVKHLPDLVTKADLEQAVERLEHRLTPAFFRSDAGGQRFDERHPVRASPFCPLKAAGETGSYPTPIGVRRVVGGP
jgi:hypothetical protein